MSTAVTPHHHDSHYDSGFLPVSPIHTLYYTQYGNPNGKPALFIHGGPGMSSNIWCAQFFDPAIYRLVQYDQRGSGQSTPLGELNANTSQHLVSDIEVLRKHLGIAKWHLVFGGSWGSTLALLYSQAHPELCGSLILRGICLMSQEEYALTLKLTENLWPDVYEQVFGGLDPKERAQPFQTFLDRLTTGDQSSKFEAAKLYTLWAVKIGALMPPPGGVELFEKEDPEKFIASSLVNAHYMANAGFMREMEILEPQNMKRIQGIPTSIVNGRYDMMCPLFLAWRLHRALPGSKLYIVEGAGHASGDAPIKDKLIELSDKYAKLDL